MIVIAPPTGQCENEEWPIGPKILSHDQRPDLSRCHLIIKSVPLSKSSQSALSLKAASQSLSLLNWYIFSLSLSLKAISLSLFPPPPPHKKVSPWNRQQARHPFEISRHKEFPAFLVYWLFFRLSWSGIQENPQKKPWDLGFWSNSHLTCEMSSLTWCVRLARVQPMQRILTSAAAWQSFSLATISHCDLFLSA